MDQNMLVIIISLFALLISFYCFYLINDHRKKAVLAATDNFSSRPLQLQAYERLVLLAERIAIPNLVSRVNIGGTTAREMQKLLLETIKQEYEYNASQQVYVAPLAWEAIRNLKEQNMLIINEVGAMMPPDASGFDLNRQLMEFMMTQKKGELHKIVLEALNFEAKKILK